MQRWSTLDGVLKDGIDEELGGSRVPRHARTRVDLNEPRLEVLRQHEVRAKQLKRSLNQAKNMLNHA